MKKTRFLILILLAVAAWPARAQAQSHVDVVRLHNGSVIRGTVTEMVPDKSLTVETRDGNVFVFKMAEVASVEAEMPMNRGNDRDRYRDRGYRATRDVAATPPPSKFNKPRGYLGLVETGMTSWGTSEDISTSVTMINGYRFFPQLAIGVGAGFEGWNGSSDVVMPLFLHLRSDFIKNRVSPFVALNLGGYVPLEGDHEGGMVEIQGGVSFNVGRRFRMAVGLSYVASEYYSSYYLDSSSRYGYYDYYTTEVDAGLRLKVGFSF